MDAAEENSDVKLYKASGSLLANLERRLPRLIHKPPYTSGSPSIRHFVLIQKHQDVNGFVDTFQEWPQLLDPRLPALISILNDAFLSYLSSASDQYDPSRVPSAFPLPRAICKLLYTFCKVRGQKVIVRFLSNEPRHLQPLINALRSWGKFEAPVDDEANQAEFTWEEKYIMLLWLSHLMLIPFDLSTASYGDAFDSPQVRQNFDVSLPPVAISVLTLGLKNLDSPGKERESAAAVLVRLALRPDMRKLGVLDDLVKLALSRIRQYEEDSSLPVYHLLGTLSLLSGLFNSGSEIDVAPFVIQCFQVCHQAASTESTNAHSLNASASSRKLLIKILRSIMLKTLLLGSRDQRVITTDQVTEMLEDSVDYLLQALADRDTPIRFAASKALSMITLKLDSSFASEIVEGVLGSLGENLLYEMPGTGRLVVATDLNPEQSRTLKPNLAAVDPLRWQGLMLTLAHLLYRRCPPTDQLPDILKALLNGLDFEQRTANGVSIGTGVRDAACFGLWALSRKYTTAELMAVDIKLFESLSPGQDEQRPDNIIQVVACHLVESACLDPSGNIRRGSSAALQELIGRHPDTVQHGIPLVQIVDYHSVARRSRAVLEVAISASKLSPLYHAALTQGLLEWRGIRYADAESRRIAAQAIGNLCRLTTPPSVNSMVDHLISKLKAMPLKTSGSVMEMRHGLLLALSYTIVSPIQEEHAPSIEADSSHLQQIVGSLHDGSLLLGQSLKRSAIRADLMFEAASRLFSSLCRTLPISTKQTPIPKESIDFMTERLTTHLESESDIVIEESTRAIKDLFKILSHDNHGQILHDWLEDKTQQPRAFSSKGRILTLGTISNLLDETLQREVFAQLQDFVIGSWSVEVRTTAIRSLADAQIDRGAQIPDSLDLSVVLRCGLCDYTTDQRGDIGSLTRIEAIRYTRIILESQPQLHFDASFVHKVIPLIARLAAEKLDKVRYQAWTCLELWWQEVSKSTAPSSDVAQDVVLLTHDVKHLAETSSADYFLQLLKLLVVPWIRQPLLQGFMSSACAGTEAIIRYTRAALVEYLLSARQSSDTQIRSVSQKLHSDLNEILSESLTDDRYALPTMEILGFLLTQNLLDDTNGSNDDANTKAEYKKSFMLVQKAHFKSANIPRLEAAIRAYEGLLLSNRISKDVVKKLSGMLVHPYPKVRNIAAETIFVHAPELNNLRKTNWSAPPRQLKDRVEELKKELLVA